MTSSFSATLANWIRPAVSAIVDIPIYSDVDAAHDDADCLIVTTDDTEEIIPGNFTAKVTLYIYLRLDPAQRNASDIRSISQRVQAAIAETLATKYRMQELDADGCPATLLEQPYLELLPADAEQPFYQSRLRLRVYLQF